MAHISERIPGISSYIGSISKQLGNFLLATGVMMTAMAAVPFRRGERWAWYTMWVVPVLLLIQSINSNFGNGWQFDVGAIPLTVGGLPVSFRRFFPAKPR